MSENFEHRPRPPFGEQLVEPENTSEQELSPEVIEKVMEKVQDIDQEGLAFTFTSLFEENFLKKDKLSTLLQQGLLGQALGESTRGSQEDLREKWQDSVKNRRTSLIHFNLVGRQYETDGWHDTNRPRISVADQLGERATESGIIYSRYQQHASALLFDVSPFQEKEPVAFAELDNLRQESRTFQAVSDSKRDSKGQLFFEAYKKNKPLPSGEYGFVASFRIAPRLLRGIVLKVRHQQQLLNEDDGSFTTVYMESQDKALWIAKAHEVADAMLTACEDQRSLLPIYSINGDLLWPKQMTYEEVKKFVTERKVKKSEEEQPLAPDKSSPE